MKEHGERKTLLPRPQKILLSGFKLERGPIITPLLLFCLEKGVILRDVFWLLQYTTHRCFESFVENAVDARRKVEANLKMRLKKTLQNSRENYRVQQTIWERGVQTFLDFSGTTTKMSNLHLKI